MAYSPLCRGFLSAIDSFHHLSENDTRRALPRFQGALYEENKRRVSKFFDLAASKGCTPSQLALAWVHSQGEDVFPIPGTKSSVRIAENAGAVQVLAQLSSEDLQNIAECAETLEGHRCSVSTQKRIYTARM